MDVPAALANPDMPSHPMTVDEYLAWGEGRDGRFELIEGNIVAMPSESLGHMDTKYTIYFMLKQAISDAGLPLHVAGDGPAVRISATTAYEPDALVYAGAKLPANTVVVPEPVIVVEVLSPGTRRTDTTEKFSGYFSLPSVLHYLIVDAAKALVVHHARGGDGVILSRIVTEGALDLTPPGLMLAVSAIFPR